MKIMGKEFPETPAGYRAAADHVFTLGPVFERDGYELLREARYLEDADRLRRHMAVVAWVIAAGLTAFYIWNNFI